METSLGAQLTVLAEAPPLVHAACPADQRLGPLALDHSAAPGRGVGRHHGGAPLGGEVATHQREQAHRPQQLAPHGRPEGNPLVAMGVDEAVHGPEAGHH